MPTGPSEPIDVDKPENAKGPKHEVPSDSEVTKTNEELDKVFNEGDDTDHVGTDNPNKISGSPD